MFVRFVMFVLFRGVCVFGLCYLLSLVLVCLGLCCLFDYARVCLGCVCVFLIVGIGSSWVVLFGVGLVVCSVRVFGLSLVLVGLGL